MPLSDEQKLIRDTARAFARDKLAPNAAEWDREARFPLAAVEVLMPPVHTGALQRLRPRQRTGVKLAHIWFFLSRFWFSR